MGLGFIGSEVSASLRQLGIEVTPSRAPRALAVSSRRGGPGAHGHPSREGVELVLEDSVSAFEGSGRVERVRTKKGRVLECDMVVPASDRSNIELLAAAAPGSTTACSSTSVPDVPARRVRRGRRDESPASDLRPPARRALEQRIPAGRAAAVTAGRRAALRLRPFLLVDQYEHSLQYVGFATSWTPRVSCRPRVAASSASTRGWIVRAVVGLNRGGDPEDPKWMVS